MTPMAGRIQLTFQREPNYFQAECVLGPNRQTIVCRDSEQNRIVGLASRSVRPVFVNGEVCRVGYLSSLRFTPAARNRGLLALGFRFLRELHDADPGRPEFYLTTIAEENVSALHLLTSARAGLPTYHPLSRLHTFILPIRQLLRKHRQTGSVGRLPANARFLQSDSFSDLIPILLEAGRTRNFFPVCGTENFAQPEATFRGLRPENVRMILLDDQVVAIGGVWNQRSYRQTVITGYDPATRVLRPCYNLWAWFRGGVTLPAIGHAVEADYVCFPLFRDGCEQLLPWLLGELAAGVSSSTQCLLLGLCDADPLLPLARPLASSVYTTRLFAVSWGAFPQQLVETSPHRYHLETGCL